MTKLPRFVLTGFAAFALAIPGTAAATAETIPSVDEQAIITESPDDYFIGDAETDADLTDENDYAPEYVEIPSDSTEEPADDDTDMVDGDDTDIAINGEDTGSTDGNEVDTTKSDNTEFGEDDGDEPDEAEAADSDYARLEPFNGVCYAVPDVVGNRAWARVPHNAVAGCNTGVSARFRVPGMPAHAPDATVTGANSGRSAFVDVPHPASNIIAIPSPFIAGL